MKNNYDKNILVFGHKNPDTDSICSAICYADLMNKVNERNIAAGQPDSGDVYVPCRAGVISAETTFVLDKFKFPIPRIYMDVRPQVRDLEIRNEKGILPDMSLRNAWERMTKNELQTLPVVDSEGVLKGVISINDIAMANMDIIGSSYFENANVPVRNILETIEGELEYGDIDSMVNSGRVRIGASTPESIRETHSEGDILIVGNRYDNIMTAIGLGCTAVIVCMAEELPVELVWVATRTNCTLIRTMNDTYTVARLISQSMPVSKYMKTDVLSFEASDQLDDVKEIMSKVRHNYFPVMDKGNMIGLISKRNLISLKKKRLVLVDHNERSQCVDGFDEAEILAIIDHHRIGDVETTGPVIFRNVPVGCTATILNDMYHEYGIEIEPRIAGLLLSAILSDTLCFRSPTCTKRDVEAGKALAEIAGIDYNEHANAMFDAGEDLTGKTPESIFRNDYKILRTNGVRVAIAQGTFNSPNNRSKAIQLMNGFIDSILESDQVDLAFYIATSIQDQSSDIIHAGKDAEAVLLRAFANASCGEGTGVHVPGLVSRKKQFVPGLINSLST
ncbi:MAG: putative manganese-dependent inorganic diphosphatase [Eubacteriales bacterium]|nr:putative manganese-dependent inorganic diphosphatase [Eubacteriales bacterium]